MEHRESLSSKNKSGIIMYYYILKKFRKISVLEILYTLYMHLYFDTFTRWECTGICQGGGCSAQMQKVYECKIQKNWCTVTVAPTIEHHEDANITLRFRDNRQNCRRIVTWHKYTFILIRYNNRRAKPAGQLWNAHTKTPLIIPKILKC